MRRTAFGLGAWLTLAPVAALANGAAPVLSVQDGGTGANTAAAARGNLGLGALATQSAVTASQLPAPTTSTLGGVEAVTSTAHQWVAYIDASGVPHMAQPSFGDISGSVSSGQLAAGAAAGNLGFTPSAVLNVKDFGAQCDGSTDDSTAVNNAIAAAWAKLKTSGSGYTVIKIVGPTDAGNYCRVTAVNATGMEISKTGSKLIFDDLRLNCNSVSNSNYGICFDLTGSRQILLGAGFALTGAGAIGVQFGTAYVPIGIGVGQITGGTGGTTGTYNVPLTGGTGTGATANITVSGGAVTAVTFVSQGSGYADGDALSAASASIGGVTGFSFLVVGSHDCCFVDFDHTNIVGSFSFAALYNDQSESTHLTEPTIINSGSTTGPIAAINGLGGITGGTGGTTGTYNVPLTGGTGTGATANITVSGGAVTSIYLTYQGKGYAAGDVLGAASGSIGGVAGFSVPVANISPFAYVMDGSNHWRKQSAFIAWGTDPFYARPVDAFYTFTQDKIDGGNILYLSSAQPGVPLWVSYARTFNTHELYEYSGGGAPDIEVFDNSATGSSASSSAGMTLDFTPEYGGTSVGGSIFFYGSNATPVYNGLRVRDYADSSAYLMGLDSNITGITINGDGAGLAFPYAIGGGFASPSLWTINASVEIPSSLWSSAINFTGLLCDASCAFYGAYQGNAPQLNFFNSYSAASAIENFDCPTQTSGGGCIARFFRTTGFGGLLQIFAGNNTTNVQDNLNAQASSFMQGQAGTLRIGSTSYCPTGAELCITGGGVQLAAYTVSTLPTCSSSIAGDIAYVTDASSPTYNATLTGGGSTKTLAMCNSSNWTAH